MIGITRLRPPLWLRAVGAAALAFWGAYYLARQYHQIHPLGGWLVFDLAKMWLWDLFLTAACASFGHAVVKRVLGTLHIDDLSSIEDGLREAFGL